MSVLDSQDVLRPGPTGLKAVIARAVLAAMPWFFSILRRVKPIVKVGDMVLTSRYDDVREVFASDHKFGVIYKAKLDVIMGGEPFFLGMDIDQSARYERDTDALRKAIRQSDLPQLAKNVETRAEAIVAGAGGSIEVVDALVRRVTFDFLQEYFGVPNPPQGDMRVWATRLFEFQFADQGNDPALRAEVDQLAPALRKHIDAEIQRRKSAAPVDDVLGRCLEMQKAGVDGFTDVEIRTALLGVVVGGPPQPPMVVPQALEQLLRRPEALAQTQAAAMSGDDEELRRCVFEAMRFDPLAPGLPRVAIQDSVLAQGTSRETKIAKGERVLAAFASAMRDPRRVGDPEIFNSNRPASDYIHFGYGRHECFGRHINRATLHLMLKPLLRRKNIRRAPGPEGKLSKNGAFAERLVVLFD